MSMMTARDMRMLGDAKDARVERNNSNSVVDMRIVETGREDTEAMEVEKSRCKSGKRDSRLINFFLDNLTIKLFEEESR